ncbi:hypothetical protein DFH06DRAFT_1144006 [Mycena polygramma]|nr:hypothetical protein DFH06DRAFT_1144006 [Mycena polygramma]
MTPGDFGMLWQTKAGSRASDSDDPREEIRIISNLALSALRPGRAALDVVVDLSGNSPIRAGIEAQKRRRIDSCTQHALDPNQLEVLLEVILNILLVRRCLADRNGVLICHRHCTDRGVGGVGSNVVKWDLGRNREEENGSRFVGHPLNHHELSSLGPDLDHPMDDSHDIISTVLAQNPSGQRRRIIFQSTQGDRAGLEENVVHGEREFIHGERGNHPMDHPSQALLLPSNRVMSASRSGASPIVRGINKPTAAEEAPALEDGNADEEAEELIPGPNFYLETPGTCDLTFTATSISLGRSPKRAHTDTPNSNSVLELKWIYLKPRVQADVVDPQAVNLVIYHEVNFRRGVDTDECSVARFSTSPGV